jgi:phosphatidylserine/phosphatidylglycerophosphate/cardiolipin synthase-like enzyme
LLLYWIGQANVSIHILIYSLTLPNITQALTAEAARNVTVQIVMDHTQAGSSSLQYPNLTAAGLQVRLSKGAYEMHDKFAVIDNHIIITAASTGPTTRTPAMMRTS